MADLLSFVWAVTSHWLVLISGALITLLGLIERLRGRELPLRLYAFLMLFFVFCASFLAWEDQRNSVRSLTMELEGEKKKYSDLRAAKAKVDSLLQERDSRIDELSNKFQDASRSRPIEVKIAGTKPPILSPPQERLLELLVQYQKRFAATKLVVGRKTGRLHFDNEPQKGTGISLIKELYASEDSQRAAEFERLMESMPSEYVRLLGEMRLDSPFVVSVTDEGMRYIRSK